jgi:hypothetical protein
MNSLSPIQCAEDQSAVSDAPQGRTLRADLLRAITEKPKLPAFGETASSTGNTWPACGC